MDGNRSSPRSLRVLELFEEGRQFTEELLRENERLRGQAVRLRQEMGELEHRLAQADVPRFTERIRSLEDENGALREQLDDLRGQFAAVEGENREFADRYVQVERQNSDLINLYVASYRLHSTLEYVEVVAIIKEVVINMVGAERFGVYVLDEPANRLELIAHEELDEGQRGGVNIGQGPLGAAAERGVVWVAPNAMEAQEAGSGDPIACIPLKVGDRLIGAIAIHRLLVQKSGFEAVDFELFDLLGGHAATALYGSTLYRMSERKRTTLEGFVDLLRTPLPQPPVKS